jgi:hypothetical protein
MKRKTKNILCQVSRDNNSSSNNNSNSEDEAPAPAPAPTKCKGKSKAKTKADNTRKNLRKRAKNIRTPTAGFIRILTEKNMKYNMVLYSLPIKSFDFA